MMADDFRVAELTTCEVAEGGIEIRLNLVDDIGRPLTLALPAHLASTLVLTLPRLMDRCLRELRGDGARLVFPMSCWGLEAAVGADAVILTLMTPDGFSVAFAVPMDDARDLAETLQAHCTAPEIPMPARILN
jgi:hypothetical protein